MLLFGRKFILRTDHQALTTLFATSSSGHRPLRIYQRSDRLCNGSRVGQPRYTIELTAASSTDLTFTQVRYFIQNGWPRHPPAGLETYFWLRYELSVFDDVCVSRGIRAVTPTSLQQQLLHNVHEGHPGIVRTTQRCRNTVWWPAIDRHIETFLRDCEGCAVCEKSMKPTQPPLQPIHEKSWQHI